MRRKIVLICSFVLIVNNGCTTVVAPGHEPKTPLGDLAMVIVAIGVAGAMIKGNTK